MEYNDMAAMGHFDEIPNGEASDATTPGGPDRHHHQQPPHHHPQHPHAHPPQAQHGGGKQHMNGGDHKGKGRSSVRGNGAGPMGNGGGAPGGQEYGAGADSDRTPVVSERGSDDEGDGPEGMQNGHALPGMAHMLGERSGGGPPGMNGDVKPEGQEVIVPMANLPFPPPSTASPSASHPGPHPYPYPPMGYAYPGYPPPPRDPNMPAPPPGSEAAAAAAAAAGYGYPPPMPNAYMPPPGAMYPPMGHPPYPMDPMNPNAPPMPYGYPYGYPPHPAYQHGRYGSVDHGMPHPGVVFARSTDPRIARPKVKLTYEDKRRIVEIARSNSSLRQEDIAQQYGVDRSTISKILISSHRWTGPPQPPVQPIIKHSNKSAGGRFPAIETKMHEWMDAQFDAGYEIRDNVARDKAKEIARMMGFTEERFKASAKWLDKFKERRKQNGQRASVTATYESNRPNLENASDGVPIPMPTPPPASAYAMPGYNNGSGYYGMPGFMGDGVHSGSNSPATGPHGFLSRSQSSATLASSDSSGLDAFGMHPAHQASSRMNNRSESDMMSIQGSVAGGDGMSEVGMSTRQRSRSSPQHRPMDLAVDGGHMDPASGRAPKMQTNAGLHRQNSYHGAASPSPRRPNGLHRANSSTSSISNRRSHRPQSLAASAFGLTPMQHDDFSPQPSPSTNMQPFPHGSMSNVNMTGSMTSSTSSLPSSQTGSSVGQPLTPSHPPGLFTNNVLETRMPDPQYFMPNSAGLDQAQYAYYNSGYGSHPTSANSDHKATVGWRQDE